MSAPLALHQGLVELEHGQGNAVLAQVANQRREVADHADVVVATGFQVGQGVACRRRNEAGGAEQRLADSTDGAEADAAAFDLANSTWAELVEARAEVERARALGGLYATAILPQANTAVEAALSAYRVGEVDYSTLIESQMTVNRYEIALVRITAEYHQAMARIDALLGRAGGDR